MGEVFYINISKTKLVVDYGADDEGRRRRKKKG